jgi:benzylsuccinate CoA-transferase BbsF subunit
MLEASVHFASSMVMDYTVNGTVQTRMGNRNPGAAPHGVYPCRGEERWCAIAVFSDREWDALCKAMGSPKWTKSAKFDTLLHRTENADELDELIGKWTRKLKAEDVMAKLQAVGVAAGVVQTGEDLVDKDPQMRHRDHFVEIEHAEMGKHLTERPPYRLSKTPSQPQRPFPSFGEHTELVCKEILGMGDEEFAELIGAGVLA